MTVPVVARRRTLAVVAAAASLLTLLAVPPLALATLLGDPVPRHWPTAHALSRLLTAPVSDATLLHLVAAVTWIAWVHLLACVIVELLRQLRGTRLRVPLGGVNQRLAQQLVAALLVSVHSAGTGAALTPALAAAATPVAALRLPLVGAPLPGPVTITPPPAPHPSRAAAAAATQPVAVTTGAVDALPTGPQKADAFKEYVVAPPHGRHHDTLWDIAERHLGDPLRWKEIFDLTDGRTMPDGQRFTRASLIRPGWVLRMPVDAIGVPAHSAATAEPRTVPPPRPAPPPATGVGGPVDGEPAGPVRLPAPPPSVPPVEHRDVPPAPAPITAAHRHDLPAIPVGAGLGVAALGILAALERRRRAAARRRRPGTRLRLPEAALREVELTLRHRAREARAIADTVRLALALAAHRDAQPTVHAVRHPDDGAVELRLDGDHVAPPPFEPVDGGWLLRADQHGYLFAVTDRDDPVPVLVPVGSADGAACYVNLETCGVAGITGSDDAELTAVLAGVVRSLAGAPWSEQTQLVVPARLAAAADGLERVDVLTDPPTLLEHVAGYARRVAAGLPPDTNLDAARRAGDAEAVGVVVLVGFRQDELPASLLDAARRRSDPIVALLAGPVDGAIWQLADGRLTVPGVPEPVEPVRADAAEVTATQALLAQAADPGEASADDPDVAAFAEDCPPDPREQDETTVQVSMLGPVELTCAGKPPKPYVRELVLYLALHRRPVEDTVVFARVFPDSEFDRNAVRVRMWEARRVLAGALVHVEHRWGVTDEVGTDWQRFQALAKGTPAEQRTALTLVRGRPFEGLESEWIGAEGHDRVMEAAIVDLALSVAQTAIDDGDDRTATEAVEAGLRACPYDERLYRLGMRAAAARDATGEVRAYRRTLAKVLDVEVEPDDHIQPETERLYRELVGDGRRAG